MAAHKQGKFDAYHAKIFENMRSLSDQKLDEIAVQVGLDMKRFKADMMDRSIDSAITKDIQEGQKAGVRGTPTIFVNGRRLQNRSLQGFQALINEELLKAQKK